MKPYFKRNTALSIKVAAMVSAILITYWKDLSIIWTDALKSEMTSYILAIPFLLAFMLYRKRKVLKAVVQWEKSEVPSIGGVGIEELIGLAMCLSAFFLYAYGSYTFNPLEYHLISLPLFVAGCTLFLFNYQTIKALIFPIAFLFLLVPLPAKTMYAAGSQLSVLTSNVVYSLLKVFGLPVKLSSAYEAPAIIIQDSSGQSLPFAIDIACAGIYSLLGFIVFALFLADITKGSARKKLGLFLTGFLLIYGLNIVRVTIIVLVGYRWGLETAMGLLHITGGFVLIFLGTLFMLVLGEKALKIKFFGAKIRSQTCSVCEQSQQENENFCLLCGRFLNSIKAKMTKKDIYKIIVLLIIGLIILNLRLPTFVLTNKNFIEINLQELTGTKLTQQFLPTIPGYEPKFLYRDTQFERWSQQDASLVYIYYPDNKSHAPIWVGIEIADSYSKVHRWETCLITYAAPSETVTTVKLKDTQILEDPPLVGRFFVFRPQRSNLTQAVLYWYGKAAFKVGSGWGLKYVKTSTMAFVKPSEISNPEEYSELEKKLLAVAQSIASHWEPVKAWSFVVLGFAKWGLAFSTISMIVPAAIYVKRTWRNRKNSIQLYKQLNWYSSFLEEEKLAKKIVNILTENGKSTGVAIAKSYQKLTEKPIETDKLLKTIKYAEESGLIKRDIINKEDEPFLVWKSQIPP